MWLPRVVEYSIVHIQTRSRAYIGKKRKKKLKSKRETTLILVFETSKFEQRHLSATYFQSNNLLNSERGTPSLYNLNCACGCDIIL